MPTPVQISDYSVLDQAPFLIEFFKGSDVAAWAAANDEQYNDLEQSVYDVMNNIWLDLAIGVQLDVLGRQLGLQRNGLDDTTYRILLKLKSYVNRAGGTPEAAIQAMVAIFNIAAPIYQPLWAIGLPAAFAISTPTQIGYGTSFDLVDNNGNTIVDNHGNTIELVQFVALTPTQIAQIAPAGVAMASGDYLIDNNGNNIVDNNGNLISVLAFSAAP
jgi:hypothetical protein